MSTPTLGFKLSILDDGHRSSTSCGETDPTANSEQSTNIVVLHGINGNHEDTWTMASGELWLEDMAQKIPRSRFMTFQYNSDIFTVGWELISPLGIWTIATQLLQSLMLDRRQNSRFHHHYIFIAQGFGGIVVKQALWIASHQHTYLPIAARTLGLIFFGTPHLSHPPPAYLDNRALWERTIFDMVVASCGTDGRNLALFSLMRQSSRASLVDGRHWVEVCERFQSISERYKAINIFSQDKTQSLALLVNCQEAAYSGSSSDQIWGRNRSYLSLCTFSGAEDEDFLRLLEELTTMINTGKDLNLDPLRFRERLAALYREPPPSNAQAHTGTFDWIWVDEEWERWWTAGDDVILHLRGSAGQGKTTLCTYLSTELRKRHNTVVIPIFCVLNDDRRDAVKYILLSILRYLLGSEPSLHTHIAEHCETISSSSIWTKEDLWTLLRTVLSNPRERPLVCLLDALDELGIDPTEGGWLLEHLASLQQETKFPFRLVISSECPADQLTQLVPAERLFVLDLDEKHNHSGDVEKVFRNWVSELVQETPVFSGLQDYLLKELNTPSPQKRTFLSNKIWLGLLAQPRFNLTLNSLSAQIDSKTSIPDMHHLYEHTLDKVSVGTQPWASKALSWITYSYRPLKLDELRVVMSLSGKGKFEEGSESLYLIEDLAEAFGPLFRIERDEIHFIHPSFKRFIVDGKTRNKGRWYSLEPIEAHADIFETCLAYLSENEVLLPSEPEDIQTFEDDIELHTMIPFVSKSMGLLLYASQYWPMHYQRSAHLARVPSGFSVVLSFLEKKEAFLWYRINRILEGHGTEAGEFSPLIVAARLGLPNLVAKLRKTVDLDDSDSQKALELASMNGYNSVVQELLKTGGNPLSIPDALVGATTMGHKEVVGALLAEAEQRKSPREELHLERLLSVAARKGHVDIVKTFLDMGTDVNSIIEDLTPLQYAASAGHGCVVELLLTRSGIDTSIGMRDAMNLAAGNGNVAIVRLLLAAAVDGVVSIERERGPLHEAARGGHLKVVDLILSKFPELANNKDETEMTALHWAAWNNHPLVIQRLVESGADIRVQDDCGNVPLVYAASYGHVKCLDTLLDHNKDDSNLDYVDSGISEALYSAALHGQADAVRQLLSHGADPDELYGDEGTALHVAANHGYVDVISVLVGPGKAYVDQKASSGRTPLHHACAYPEAMRRLIELGAYINARDSNGETTLMLAASAGTGEGVRLLLQEGAQPFANQVRRYRTPLHYAAESGSWDSVEALLAAGVAIFRHDIYSAHLTPLDVAIANGHRAIARKMMEWIIEKDNWINPFHLVAKFCSHEDTINLWLELRPADLQLSTALGSPPLFVLASRGIPSLVESLLAAGVDKDLTDATGRVALDVTLHPDVRALLDPSSKDQPQPVPDITSTYLRPKFNNFINGVFCDICRIDFPDEEFFYHCYQCSDGCFDICVSCYKEGKRCQSPTEHVMKAWFIFDEILSLEELSPWVATLKIPKSLSSPVAELEDDD